MLTYYERFEHWFTWCEVQMLRYPYILPLFWALLSGSYCQVLKDRYLQGKRADMSRVHALNKLWNSPFLKKNQFDTKKKNYVTYCGRPWLHLGDSLWSIIISRRPAVVGHGYIYKTYCGRPRLYLQDPPWSTMVVSRRPAVVHHGYMHETHCGRR